MLLAANVLQTLYPWAMISLYVTARDAELKARAYLGEQPDSFVYVLNPDGSRYRVIL
jgi:hypothetical protein